MIFLIARIHFIVNMSAYYRAGVNAHIFENVDALPAMCARKLC